LELEVLLRSKSIAANRTALNTVPATLDEFYDYILKHQRAIPAASIYCTIMIVLDNIEPHSSIWLA
jgi:hypothetical protein